MHGMVPTERGRELTRLWADWRSAIISALPEHIVGLRSPSQWLDAAWNTLSAAQLAAAEPAALVAAMREAAADGLNPSEGRLHIGPDGSVTWVPTWRAMRSLLSRAAPDLYVQSDVVRPGDEFVVQRSDSGRITYLNHQRMPERWTGDWGLVFARATFPEGRGIVKRCVLLTRDETERLADRHLLLPSPEDPESSAQRVALIRLAQLLPLEPGWGPARRFLGVVGRIWSEDEA